MKSIYEFHNFHKIYQAYMQSLSIFILTVLLCIFYCYLSIAVVSPQAKKKKKMLFLREMRPYKLELSEKTTSYFPRLRQRHSFSEITSTDSIFILLPFIFRDYVNKFYFYTFTFIFREVMWK